MWRFEKIILVRIVSLPSPKDQGGALVLDTHPKILKVHFIDNIFGDIYKKTISQKVWFWTMSLCQISIKMFVFS